MTRLPTVFLPHGGGPCFFMEWDPPDTWKKMAEFLSSVSKDVTPAPKAVLVISGHWEEPEFTVTSNARPSLIYDYSGFPPETYQLKYNAPGSPELAQRVVSLLSDGGHSGAIRSAARVRSRSIHSLQTGVSGSKRSHRSVIVESGTRSCGAHRCRSSAGAVAG